MRRLDILIRKVGASTFDHICVGNWASTPREGRATRQEQFVKARLNIEWRGTAMVTECDVNGIFLHLVQRDFGAVSKCILIIEDAGCLRRYLSDFVQSCDGRQFIQPTTFALAPRFNPSPRVQFQVVLELTRPGPQFLWSVYFTKCGAYPSLDWFSLGNELHNVVDVSLKVLCRKMMRDYKIGHGRKLGLEPEPTCTRVTMLLEIETVSPR